MERWVDRQQAVEWIDASERPMLVAAGVAVVLYLMDLAGLWGMWGLETPYRVVSAVIDGMFVVDLLAKLVVLRTAYLRSAWFLVDLLCTLPVLSTLSVAPSVFHGLRFVRMLRILRALRFLRVLRTLRVLRLVLDEQVETPETRAWNRVLMGSVVLYSLVFVGLVLWARAGTPGGEVVSVEGIAIGPVVEVGVRGLDGTVSTRSMAREDVFANADRVELLLVLGALLGLALLLVVSRYQVPALISRQVRALLTVAMPRQVAEWLLANPDQYDHTVRMPATVIFCDIKGFTATTERIGLEELKHHLERAMDAVVAAHEGRGLIIDMFIGDAVMSFRGGHIVGGEPGEIAWRVVRAALEGIRGLRTLDDPWFKEVKVGGASSANALIGAFGTSRRLSYTVLGDKVNLAARLEGACNAVGVSNLFDDETQRLTAGREDIVWRRVGRVAVQGRVGIAMGWQAFDPGDPLDWLAGYHAALEALEAQQWEVARAGFAGVLADRGQDGPSERWLDRIAQWREADLAADWVPALKTSK